MCEFLLKYKYIEQKANGAQMSIVKDFLLQLTLMVIPIFSYFTFILEKVKEEQRRGSISGLSLSYSERCTSEYGPVCF
ncbi:Uncharacterised protein [Mycobacteroides abscessus subsp. abscessus]|nr:Uncharacterised protein [Mycobacteroides abscessus subsp. abscessus]